MTPEPKDKEAIYSQVNLTAKRTCHSVLQRLLRAMLAKAPHSKILDVGCAQGIVHILVGKHDTTGVETNHQLAQDARKVYRQVLEHDMDKGPLPLEAGTFDIIVAADVIEHCCNDLGMAKELHRLLKDSGTLILSFPNIAQFFYRFKLLAGKFDYEPLGVMCDEHRHLYTQASMQRLLAKAGFIVQEALGSGTLYSYLPVWKKFLCPQIILIARKGPAPTKP